MNERSSRNSATKEERHPRVIGETYKRTFCATQPAKGESPEAVFPVPVNRKLTLDHLVDPLARLLGHELDEKPYPPPGNLGALVDQLEPLELAVLR
jgi:hypothetical protein